MTVDTTGAERGFLITQTQLAERCRMVSMGAAILLIFVGGVALIGWAADAALPNTTWHSLVAMRANTAIAFIITGLSLLLLRQKWSRRIMFSAAASILAFFVMALGLLTLMEYLFNLHLGIDQLLFKDISGSVPAPYGTRMPPMPALNFFMLGICLLSLQSPRGFSIAQWLVMLPLGLSTLALAGYLLGAHQANSTTTLLSGIALTPILAFLLAGIGIFLSRPEWGIASHFSSDGADGVLVRYFIPAIFVSGIIIGIIVHYLHEMGFYDHGFEIAFFVVMVIGTLAIMILVIAKYLNSINELRAEAEIRNGIADNAIMAANA